MPDSRNAGCLQIVSEKNPSRTKKWRLWPTDGSITDFDFDGNMGGSSYRRPMTPCATPAKTRNIGVFAPDEPSD